jgi:hypothetical protein
VSAPVISPRKVAGALALLAAAVVLAAPSGASAAPLPTFTNPCSADLDPGVCERVTYLAEQESQLDTVVTFLGWGVGVALVVAVSPILMRTFAREV